jgi:putative transposase
MKGKSKASVLHRDKGDSTLPLYNPINVVKSFTPELAPLVTEKNFSNKLAISEKDFPITKLSKTLEVDSTGKEKDLTPYWTESCLVLSKKLLSLTKTGCAGSDLSYLNELHVSTTQDSWYSATHYSPLKKKLSTTSFPLSTFSPVKFKECENTLVRSRKIRIYLTQENKQRVKRFCGLSRYWFNQAVEYLQTPGTKAIIGEVRKVQRTKEHPEWAMDCPQRIREHAMQDACRAVKNAKSKFRQTGVIQKVRFRSKKNRKQGFGFDTQSLLNDRVFSYLNHRIDFTISEPLPHKFIEGTRLVVEGNRYFLIVPVRVPRLQSDTQRLQYVALDPGVRTFLTYYAGGVHGKIGQGDFSRIFRLCRCVDQLISKMSKAKSRQKQRMKRALNRLQWRIKDLIAELHRKAAHFLVSRFETIFIPDFRTQQMIGKLHSKTSRMMATFAHYRFRTLLQSMAERYGSTVIVGNEAYTSKTCSYCGKIHKIGSRSTMKCCATVDRDDNGARGFYLASLAGSRLGSLNHVCVNAS